MTESTSMIPSPHEPRTDIPTHAPQTGILQSYSVGATRAITAVQLPVQLVSGLAFIGSKGLKNIFKAVRMTSEAISRGMVVKHFANAAQEINNEYIKAAGINLDTRREQLQTQADHIKSAFKVGSVIPVIGSFAAVGSTIVEHAQHAERIVRKVQHANLWGGTRLAIISLEAVKNVAPTILWGIRKVAETGETVFRTFEDITYLGASFAPYERAKDRLKAAAFKTNQVSESIFIHGSITDITTEEFIRLTYQEKVKIVELLSDKIKNVGTPTEKTLIKKVKETIDAHKQLSSKTLTDFVVILNKRFSTEEKMVIKIAMETAIALFDDSSTAVSAVNLENIERALRPFKEGSKLSYSTAASITLAMGEPFCRAVARLMNPNWIRGSATVFEFAVSMPYLRDHFLHALKESKIPLVDYVFNGSETVGQYLVQIPSASIELMSNLASTTSSGLATTQASIEVDAKIPIRESVPKLIKSFQEACEGLRKSTPMCSEDVKKILLNPKSWGKFAAARNLKLMSSEFFQTLDEMFESGVIPPEISTAKAPEISQTGDQFQYFFSYFDAFAKQSKRWIVRFGRSLINDYFKTFIGMKPTAILPRVTEAYYQDLIEKAVKIHTNHGVEVGSEICRQAIENEQTIIDQIVESLPTQAQTILKTVSKNAIDPLRVGFSWIAGIADINSKFVAYEINQLLVKDPQVGQYLPQIENPKISSKDMLDLMKSPEGALSYVLPIISWATSTAQSLSPLTLFFQKVVPNLLRSNAENISEFWTGLTKGGLRKKLAKPGIIPRPMEERINAFKKLQSSEQNYVIDLVNKTSGKTITEEKAEKGKLTDKIIELVLQTYDTISPIQPGKLTFFDYDRLTTEEKNDVHFVLVHSEIYRKYAQKQFLGKQKYNELNELKRLQFMPTEELKKAIELFNQIPASERQLVTPQILNRLSNGKIEQVLEIVERYHPEFITKLNQETGGRINLKKLEHYLKTPVEYRVQLENRKRYITALAFLFNRLPASEQVDFLQLTPIEWQEFTSNEKNELLKFLLSAKELIKDHTAIQHEVTNLAKGKSVNVTKIVKLFNKLPANHIAEFRELTRIGTEQKKILDVAVKQQIELLDVKILGYTKRLEKLIAIKIHDLDAKIAEKRKERKDATHDLNQKKIVLEQIDGLRHEIQILLDEKIGLQHILGINEGKTSIVDVLTEIPQEVVAQLRQVAIYVNKAKFQAFANSLQKNAINPQMRQIADVNNKTTIDEFSEIYSKEIGRCQKKIQQLLHKIETMTLPSEKVADIYLQIRSLKLKEKSFSIFLAEIPKLKAEYNAFAETSESTRVRTAQQDARQALKLYRPTK